MMFVILLVLLLFPAPAAAQDAWTTKAVTAYEDPYTADGRPVGAVGSSCPIPAGAKVKVGDRSKAIAWFWHVETATGCKGYIKATEFETEFDRSARGNIRDIPSGGRGAPPPNQSKEYWEQKARQGDQEREARWGNEAFTKAVEECGQQARYSVSVPIYNRGFSVRVTRPGHVEMVGTAQERYAFNSCMQKAGVPVE